MQTIPYTKEPKLLKFSMFLLKFQIKMHAVTVQVIETKDSP